MIEKTHSIEYFRKQLGISQRELARQAGVKNSTISRIEAGLVKPDVLTLQKLALVLRFTITISPVGISYSNYIDQNDGREGDSNA